MRVLQVHSSDELYGSDRIAVRVANVLAARAEKLEIYVPNDIVVGQGLVSAYARKSEETVTLRQVKVPVLRRKYLNADGLRTLVDSAASLYRVLRRSTPDVIYVSNSACFIILAIARVLGIKCRIAHVQEIWGAKERIILGALGTLATSIVCISEPVQASLPVRLRRRSSVIANCCDDPDETRNHIDPGRELPDDGREVRFLVASRWNSWKGHRTLLDAWRVAAPSGTLTVLGGPPSVGIAVDVLGILRDDPVAYSSVNVVGEVDDIGSYIDDCDCVIVPSDLPEPFGLVAIEAFARSKPVIASDGGGLGDIVDHGQTGWKFECGSVSALAEILKSVSVEDASRRGERARRRFEERYGPARFDRELDAFVSGALIATGVSTPAVVSEERNGD